MQARIIVLAKNESEARKKFNQKFEFDYPSVKRGQIAITSISGPKKWEKAIGTTEWEIWFRTRKRHTRRKK